MFPLRGRWQVKTQKARLEKSKNKEVLAEQSEKLDLIEQIGTAVRDLAHLLSGKQGALSDIVDKVAACDAAGVVLSSHVRAEVFRARADMLVQFSKYLEIVKCMSSDADEIKSLSEAGLTQDELKNLCLDVLESITMAMLAIVPEDTTSKAAIKHKEEAASFLDIVVTGCADEKFLGLNFKTQAEARLNLAFAMWPSDQVFSCFYPSCPDLFFVENCPGQYFRALPHLSEHFH